MRRVYVRRPLAERFWEKVDRNGPMHPALGSHCWLWTASLMMKRGGYGQLRDGLSTLKAHRVAWELARGPVPTELFVCHRCDTPRCVNPAHLFVGTHLDNMRDCVAKGRNTNPVQRGEDSGTAKLTAVRVREIRARRGIPSRTLAAKYGVTPNTIRDVRSRRTWRHIP